MAYDINQILQSIPNNPQLPQSNQRRNDIAQLLALNSNFKSKATADKPIDRDTSDPSVISRIFDILSRPNYAIANMFKEALPQIKKDAESGDILEAAKHAVTFSPSLIGFLANPKNAEAAWEGFSGRKKTTFSDVIQSAAGDNTEINPVAKYGGGLIADILLDPTTYIGAGAIKGVIGGVKGLVTKADDAAKVIDKVAPKAAETVNIDDLFRMEPKPENPEHFNLQTPKALSPDEVLKLRGEGLDISPSIKQFRDVKEYSVGDAKIKLPDITGSIKYAPEAQAALTNAAKGLEQGARVNRPKLIQDTINEILANSPRRKPEVVRKEVELFVSKLLPRTDIKAYKEVSEEFANEAVKRKSQKLDLGTFTIAPKIASPVAEGGEAAAVKYQNILDELGTAGNSETRKAQEIAQGFIDRTLSKPNKFQKGATPPAVNNPAQQANLYEKIRQLERMTKGKLNSFKMLRVAEEYLIERGFAPKFWDGTEARLSDIMLELSDDASSLHNINQTLSTQLINAFKSKDPSKISDINVQQAINNLIANNAEKEAPYVDMALEQVIGKSKEVSGIASDPKLLEFNKKLTDDLNNSLKGMSLSPGSISAARRLAQDLLGTGARSTSGAKVTQLQRYIDNNGKELWVPIQEAQTKIVDDAIGISSKEAGKIIGEGNKAAEGFMSRFATWWGQKDLRPMVLARTLTAANNASARARIYNSLHKKFSPEQLTHGFKVAQGQTLSDATGETNEIADFFSKALENLFGSTGLSDEAIAAETVAGRSGMLMRDLNRQLEIAHSDFKFTNGRIMDDQGIIHDYSGGTDWLKSWRSYNVDDPIEFMFRVETAAEQLMHKYAFMDEIAARWGTKTPINEFNTKPRLFKDNPRSNSLPDGYQKVSKTGKSIANTPPDKPHRLDGLYFPKEIAAQIERSLATWDQIYNPQSELIKFLDKVTRAWKSGVTIYAPSHHVRNFIGDVYLSWMAGVNNPSVYNKAAKILFSQKNRYTDLETVENLVGRNAVANAMTKPGDSIVRTRGGKNLTAEQIYIAAHNQGLLIYTHAIEDIFGGELFKKKILGGKVQGAARKASENREHFVRLAHFIDALSKSKEKNLDNLFYDAGKQVRKWHPDGTDLTDFERKYMRRIFPFYSWTRKAIPLLIESAVLNPAKTNLYSKGMYSLQGMMGIDSPNRTDPFPMDQLFPDWIKEKGIGPVLEHGMSGLPGLLAGLSRSVPGFDGSDSGYTVVNPSNPFIDTVAQFGGMGKASDPIKGLGEMSTPLFRIPAEVVSGKTFSGAPIEANRYIAENVPIAALGSRLTNFGPFGPTNRAESEGNFNSEALINLLFALGLRGTGPYEKQAEFEERDRRRERTKERKENR